MAEEEKPKIESEKEEVKVEKKARKSKKKEEKEDKASERETEKSLEEKKKQIFEKAKKLAEGIEDARKVNTGSLEVSKIEETDLKGIRTDNMIVPLDDYVKSGIYLGTKVITPDMKPYVFKRRTDGLAIINTKMIDEKIRKAASFLAEYAPKKIVVTCKREAGWKALEAFSKVTGIKAFTKKYPAGIITNTNLPEFFEPELALIIDPWIDKNLLSDSLIINIPVISLCDTNNFTSNIDLVIPCNNKGNKSIGLVLWILAREYQKEKGLGAKMPELKEFTGE